MLAINTKRCDSIISSAASLASMLGNIMPASSLYLLMHDMEAFPLFRSDTR